MAAAKPRGDGACRANFRIASTGLFSLARRISCRLYTSILARISGFEVVWVLILISILHTTLLISTNSVPCSPRFSRPHFIDQIELRLRCAAKAGKTTTLDDIMDTILAGLRTEAHCALLST